MSAPIDNLIDLFRFVDRHINQQKHSCDPEVKLVLTGDRYGWFCQILIDGKPVHDFCLDDVNDFETAIELFIDHNA